MAEAQGTPPDAVKGGIVAYLSRRGRDQGRRILQKGFAAQPVHINPPDEQGRTMHVHLHINGDSVMLSDPYPEHGCPYVPAAGFSLMLPVADVDSWWQRAVECRLHRHHAAPGHVLGRPLCPSQGPVWRTWAFVGPKKASVMESKAMRLPDMRYRSLHSVHAIRCRDQADPAAHCRETMAQLGYPPAWAFPSAWRN
jgi:hypothetical protein